ncbi:hypothetical protein EDC02_4151 [Micromonospora sp. Llam0]|nr:hypothetical protein EDC02_4151 [Micromonospora sp. Llam0]
MRWLRMRPRQPPNGDSSDRLPSGYHRSGADITLGQKRCRTADPIDAEKADGKVHAETRDALREPTQLLPLMDSVLMTPAARWRAFGGRS